MQKTYKDEDIERILSEADDLLQQIDPKIIEYFKEEQRAQLEQQAQILKKLKSVVQEKTGRKNHQRAGLKARECTRRWMDIVQAMKALEGGSFFERRQFRLFAVYSLK